MKVTIEIPDIILAKIYRKANLQACDRERAAVEFARARGTDLVAGSDEFNVSIENTIISMLANALK